MIGTRRRDQAQRQVVIERECGDHVPLTRCEKVQLARERVVAEHGVELGCRPRLGLEYPFECSGRAADQRIPDIVGQDGDAALLEYGESAARIACDVEAAHLDALRLDLSPM